MSSLEDEAGYTFGVGFLVAPLSSFFTFSWFGLLVFPWFLFPLWTQGDLP